MNSFIKLICLATFLIMGINGLSFAAEETVYQFRSFDDPDVPANPEVCINAPFYDENFPSYVVLGASLWSLQSNAAEGKVVNEAIHQVGTGDVCAKVTDLSVGTSAPIYLEFELNDMLIKGDGSCLVTSNNIPVNGLILTGCSYTIYDDLDNNLLGGIATSNSIFNPFNLPGFQTGSFWTVHLYSDL